MNNDSVVPENVKSKEYVLVEPVVLDREQQGPVPVYTENPFDPPGKEISVSWEFPQSLKASDAFRSQVKECGYFSQKLVCCNDVWYHEEYFDPQGNPLSFWYGSREEREPNLEFQEKLKALQMLDVWAVKDSEVGEDMHKTGEDMHECSNDEKPGFTPMTEDEKRIKKKFNRNKTKWKFRMLINLNKMHHMYSLSFSYRTNEEIIARGGKPLPGLCHILPLEQQRDRDEVMKAVAKLTRKLRKHFGGDFPYIIVLEKHTGQRAEIAADPNKIGTYHVHIATSKYIDARELQKLWGYGTARTDNFNKKRKAGSRGKKDAGRDIIYDPGMYMSKYMEKDMDDAELHGKRAYSPSQGLIQPKPIRDDAEIADLLKEVENEGVTVYDKMIECEFSLHRRGQEPELVKFTKRSRIYNFRRQAQKVARTCPDAAGGVGGRAIPPPSKISPGSRSLFG